MTATATSVRAAPPRTAFTRSQSAAKKTAAHESASEMDFEEFDNDFNSSEWLAPVDISETASHFQIRLSLNGIDARHVYVFATPRSILIEIRIKKSISHSRAHCQEKQYQCLTRELTLQQTIKEHSTTIRLTGGNLDLACSKATDSGDKAWSELIYFDTRSSLGPVERR